MWRGITSIIALLLMCGAAAVIVPLFVIPNMDFPILVPLVKPLHQALACESGETLEYQYNAYQEYAETHFRCVNAAGRERDVDAIFRTPANYAIGVFCLCGLLLLAPFAVAVRQGMMSQAGQAVQETLQQGYQQLTIEMTPSVSTTLNASGQQQLDALDKLRQQGLITQQDYENAKKRIIDDFRAN